MQKYSPKLRVLRACHVDLHINRLQSRGFQRAMFIIARYVPALLSSKHIDTKFELKNFAMVSWTPDFSRYRSNLTSALLICKMAGSCPNAQTIEHVVTYYRLSNNLHFNRTSAILKQRTCAFNSQNWQQSYLMLKLKQIYVFAHSSRITHWGLYELRCLHVSWCLRCVFLELILLSEHLRLF